MMDIAYNHIIRILVVDDEEETLDLIQGYLREKGFEVDTSTCAEDALTLVEEKVYRIAIIDLHLPGMSGSELLNIIKDKDKGILVIMITGYGTIRDAVECMKLGAADFITKPVLPDHLHLAVKRILEEARLKEEALLAEYYRDLSRTDELTGLFNFRYFINAFKQESERHLRYKHPLSMAMIDIDDFKNYNDTKGHEEGNALLKHLSHILRHNTRNCDILARYGGEEFVIIFTETVIHEAKVVSQRICITIKESLGISVTIGLASMPDDTSDYKELIKKADKAMYWGKTHGKNQTVLYTETIST